MIAGRSNILRKKIQSFFLRSSSFKWKGAVKPFSTTARPPIDFSDTKIAFRNKATPELIRAWCVFAICRIKPLVKHSDSLIKLSYKIIGKDFTNLVLKHTFFSHFCAGEDQASIKPKIQQLNADGVGSILDYAAEADLEEFEDQDARIQELVSNSTAKVRIYDYRDEELCDKRMETFMECIKAAASVREKEHMPGFAAIKLTALGNPELLKQASRTILEIRGLFERLDTDGTGYIPREKILEQFSRKIEGQDVISYFAEFDADEDGMIDYYEWTEALPLEELHLITAHCTEEGPLSSSILNAEEIELFKNMKERLSKLAELAKANNVRLMIDAEQSYFQPAIDNLANGRAREYNQDSPIIFNTYQMYLKDAYERVSFDTKRAEKLGYKFGVKLVRGAYMIMEREHAKEHNRPDPIQPTLQATHDSYNKALSQVVLPSIARGDGTEVMVATHNQESIELALNRMNELKLDVNNGVHFAQLLGMSDHLTLALGLGGFRAYKYTPFGKVAEVMPYLLRRAQENSDFLGGASTDMHKVQNELIRRLLRQ